MSYITKKFKTGEEYEWFEANKNDCLKNIGVIVQDGFIFVSYKDYSDGMDSQLKRGTKPFESIEEQLKRGLKKDGNTESKDDNS